MSDFTNPFEAENEALKAQAEQKLRAEHEAEAEAFNKAKAAEEARALAHLRESEASKAKTTKDWTAKDCLAEIGKILREYNGEESNIPVTHEYWKIVNQYRVLNSK